MLNVKHAKFGRLRVFRQYGRNKYGKALWKCRCTCGKECIVLEALLKNGSTKSCGCLRKEITRKLGTRNIGRGNPSWRGGKCYDGRGYVLIHKPEHPQSDGSGYVRKHRLVLERCFDRYLTSEEEVHHKDEIRNHNNPENLFCFENKSQHQGFHWKKRRY